MVVVVVVLHPNADWGPLAVGGGGDIIIEDVRRSSPRTVWGGLSVCGSSAAPPRHDVSRAPLKISYMFPAVPDSVVRSPVGKGCAERDGGGAGLVWVNTN